MADPVFTDLFSGHAGLYAQARPRYPAALFDWIASQTPRHALAWDCGCGNGQAAVDLAERFESVAASDASAAQIGQALPHARVRYSVQPAERTDHPAGAFDAVCVAQALHWFALDAFFDEVRRVGRPGGLLAAWGYHFFHVEPAFDAAFERTVLDVLAPHWAAQNRLLWNGYRDLGCPFEPLAAPAFAITCDWTLPQVLSYAQSWSAAQRCVAAEGRGFLERAAQVLLPLWGDPARVRRVTMPLHTVAWRLDGGG